MEPKGVQKPGKKQSKSETKTRPVLDTKKEVFGEAKPAPYMELSYFLRFWDVYRNDANYVEKVSQKTSKMRAKSAPKRDQNRYRKWSEKSAPPGRVLSENGPQNGPQFGPKA